MAKITLSDVAPAEAVHFTFAEDEFDLGGSGKKPYETDHAGTLSEAITHPWLNVEFPAVTVDAPEPISGFPDAADDPMSAEGSIDFNDPTVVAEAEAAKSDDDPAPVALDAGKVQTEPVTTGAVAETLAADDTSKTFDKVEN